MSVATILKSRWTGTLAMGLVALSVAILTALLLPGRADAQDAQLREAAANTTKTVGPGESLWKIAQAQLAPDAAPQQVAEEVGRIYALNRDQIGDDPNFLLVGQELFLGPALSEEQPHTNGEEATTTTTTTATTTTTSGAEETVAEPVEEPVEESVGTPVTEFIIEPITAEESATAEEPVQRAASDTASTQHPTEEDPAAPTTTEANGTEANGEDPATDTATGTITDAATAAGEEEPAEESAVGEEELSSSEPEGGIVLGGIAVNRKILGLGILSLTALIAILVVMWRVLTYRRPSTGSSLDHSQSYHHSYGENYAGYYDNYAQPHYPEQQHEEQQQQNSIAQTEAAERGAPGPEAEPAPQGLAASAMAARDAARRRRRQRSVLSARRQRRPRGGR